MKKLLIFCYMVSFVIFISCGPPKSWNRVPRREFKMSNDEPTTNYPIPEIRYVHKTVNMRSGPGKENPVIKKVPRGQEVQKIDEKSGWSQVIYSLDTGYIHSSLVKMSRLPEIEIADWNWRTDPDFGSRGSIIWVATVRNNGSRYIEFVKVEVAFRDKQGRVTDTDYSYIRGLAPGGTASGKGYATYFGTEHKGQIRVVE